MDKPQKNGGRRYLDFAVFKSFHSRKEKNLLQSRVEIFNLFNHPLFDIPTRVFGVATFGESRQRVFMAIARPATSVGL